MNADGDSYGYYRPRPRHLLLKTLIILALIAGIFGAAAYFSYTLFLEPKQALEDEKAGGAAPAPPDPTVPEFEKCVALKNQHRLVEARSALEHFIETCPASTKLDAAREALGEVNVDIFFSATAAPEKQAYTIQRGDALAKIEKKLKVPAEMIMRSNNLDDPRRLSVGQVLYVSHPKFSVVISRKEKTITLYNNGKFFKRYRARAWNVPASRTSAAINTRVTETMAWKNGQRVALGTRDYLGAAHWVQIAAASYTLYTDPAEGGEKAPAGIVLGAEEMQELSALLSRGVPVTIE
jgi:LysM repeat protein